MKKTILSLLLVAAMMLSLAACGAVSTGNSAPAAETESQTTASDDGQIIVEETPETPTQDERQDGERFEAVIMMEGMEETVRYEHIRREDLGFAMDYDYENFVRQSEGDRERFVSNWDDLVQAFAGNFQGTYVRPGNSWDLRSCRQQPGESLRDYIRRFSKQRTELPNITDSDVIRAFLASTT